MGAYLSSPNTTKHTTSGANLTGTVKVAWSASDMQGWRKSMEDAHITKDGGVSAPEFGAANLAKDDVKIFAVFDGHGGTEVANFCEKHFTEVLTQSPYWKLAKPQEVVAEATLVEVEGGNDSIKFTVADALSHTFHELDQMIDSSVFREELTQLSHSGKAKALKSGAQPSAGDLVTANRKHVNSIDAAGEQDVEEDLVNGVVGKEKDGDEISTADAIDLFHKLLSMSGKKDKPDADGEADADASGSSSEAAPPTVGRQRIPSTCVSGIDPTTGKHHCLLPDHPVHAGCTSVVCVMIGRDLVVANAGDSRAVLQRGNGAVKALSYDHKPEHHIETNRISKAGGFVNQFGRVNGNLNLSRSIGDLKYKQNCDYGAAEQIITAQPDVVCTTLEEDDEFIILGCDGIWDCLSNEEACEYVAARIDTMTTAEIVEEVLSTIISDDPRASQGIGGDNMTIVIVDLQPEKRSYFGKEAAAAGSS
jgi:serine/threonine protein phosphatase PrpC